MRIQGKPPTMGLSSFSFIFLNSARNWRDTIGKSVGKSPNFRTRPTLKIHQPRLTRCLATMRSRCELARPPSSAPHRMLSDLVYQCTIHGQNRDSNGIPMDKLCLGYQLRSVGWLKAKSTGTLFFLKPPQDEEWGLFAALFLSLQDENCLVSSTSVLGHALL